MLLKAIHLAIKTECAQRCIIERGEELLVGSVKHHGTYRTVAAASLESLFDRVGADSV